LKNRATAIIIRNARLLLMHRQKSGRNYYILPGGNVEWEESFEEACIREVKEETGLNVLALQLVRKYITLDRVENYFIARVSPGEPVLGGPEAQRQSPQDQYGFEWVDAVRLEEVNLLPVSARSICLEALR